jgi:hypothetical protein
MGIARKTCHTPVVLNHGRKGGLGGFRSSVSAETETDAQREDTEVTREIPYSRVGAIAH